MSTSRAPDDWRPSASLDVLKRRARILERIRAFFSERGVLEVETPQLSQAATTDPNLASLSTRYTGPGHAAGRTLYLGTSPEFPMKRLLASGSGSIYQICKVFRNGEAGRLHNPEFTMLEWYRVGLDSHQLMDEVAALITHALERDGAKAPEKISYRDAFLRYCELDPHDASLELLANCVRHHGISIPEGTSHPSRDFWLDLLLTHVVEPHLGDTRMSFVYDYPASQAALARVRAGDPPLAERFELYMEGIEIANGFHELADPAEQRRRFEHDLARRRDQGLVDVPMDDRLLAGLTAGLPACAGVALGCDRLLMMATGAKSIDDVLAFPLNRA